VSGGGWFLVFFYDQSRDMGLRVRDTVYTNGHTVSDVTYLSPLGGEVPAYLVRPEGKGPFPGIIFLHHGLGDRRAFLPEAKVLASAGVVSLLPDAPHNRPSFAGPAGPVSVEEAARRETDVYRQLVVDIRRGIDLLQSLPLVRATRLAYVGHSLGATWGGPLAGVERRLAGYVLMAGHPSLTEACRSNPHPAYEARRARLGAENLNRLLLTLAPLDAVHWVNKAAPAHLLFQFARNDEFITEEEAERYYQAASEPKMIAWYDTDHLFTRAPEARLQRACWLSHLLRFGPLEPKVLAALADLSLAETPNPDRRP